MLKICMLIAVSWLILGSEIEFLCRNDKNSKLYSADWLLWNPAWQQFSRLVGAFCFPWAYLHRKKPSWLSIYSYWSNVQISILGVQNFNMSTFLKCTYFPLEVLKVVLLMERIYIFLTHDPTTDCHVHKINLKMKWRNGHLDLVGWSLCTVFWGFKSNSRWCLFIFLAVSIVLDLFNMRKSRNGA